MKTNPLFFDSTKFRGDVVFVTLQVEGVELMLGESFFARVMRGSDIIRNIRLIPVGLRKWSAETRLEYKEKFSVELVIKRDEGIIETSPRFDVVSCYTIQMTWIRSELPPLLVPDIKADTVLDWDFDL